VEGKSGGGVLRSLIFWLSRKKSVTDTITRLGRRYGFAGRFVAGETLEEAMVPVAELARNGRRVILNHLGENVATADEARRSRDSYIEMLHALHRAGIDGNIAVKPTQIGLDFDPGLCLSLCGEIAAAAKALGRTIEVDMEGSAYTDATLQMFEAVQKAHGNAGLAIQAYLRRSEADLQRLAPLRPKVRVVKGAYQEPPAVAFPQKSEVNANYRRLLDLLLNPGSGFSVAIATHDPELVAHAQDRIVSLKVARECYEFQMLLGIRRDLQRRIMDAQQPLRVYVPFGTAWCPYFMRRLAERPANVWFVVRSLFAERKN